MAAPNLFYKYVKYPLITEKTVLMVERENKVVLIVDKKANKPLLKKIIREQFGVDVKKVNVLITPKGEKKAIITFYNADDALKVATALGIL
jgi:large subunit ribosomal protein L23